MSAIVHGLDEQSEPLPVKSVFQAELFLKVVLVRLEQMQSALDPFVAELAVGGPREVGLEAVLVQPLAHLLAAPLGERERVRAERERRRRFTSGLDRAQRAVAEAKVALEARVRCRSSAAALKVARRFRRRRIALDKMIRSVVFVGVTRPDETRLVYVDEARSDELAEKVAYALASVTPARCCIVQSGSFRRRLRRIGEQRGQMLAVDRSVGVVFELVVGCG